MRIHIATALCAIAVVIAPCLARPATAQDVPPISRDTLLNGGYSFHVQGTDPAAAPVSIVGLLAFDGQGHVTDGRFRETVAGQRTLWGGASDFTFTGGEYSVSNHDIGQIHLRYMNSQLQLCWEFAYDFALTKGGEGFFLNLARFSLIEFCQVSEDLPYTLGGQAAKQ